jgi:ABC-type bacteriocin/lantibiotic exporter with double-glycine peptidase domain
MKIPVVMQMHSGENGIAMVATMLLCYKKYVSFEELRKTCTVSRNGMSVNALCSAAESYGLMTETAALDLEALRKEKKPVVVCWKKKYFAIVKKISRNKVSLVDPAKGAYTIRLEDFQKKYTGTAIRFWPGPQFQPGGHQKSTVQILYDRVKDYKFALILTILLNSLVVLLGTYQVTARKNMIDDVMTGGNLARYWPLTATLIGLALAIFLLNSIKLIQLYSVSRSMSASSGGRLFRKLFALPIRFYEQNSKGELLERIETNTSLDNSLISSLVPKVVNSVMTFFYFGLMLQYNVVVALICIFVEVFFILLTVAIQRRNAIIQRSVNASSGAMNTSLINGMSVIETIKATGSERQFFGMWSSTQQSYQEDQHVTVRLTAIASMTETIHSITTSAVLLFLGTYFVMIGQITLGMLTAFQSIYNTMSSSLQSMLSTANTMQKMRTSIERIEDINAREAVPEIPLGEEEPDKLKGIIEVDHVSYCYNNGDRRALDDISFTVGQREMVALVGASGCGKSTLMKILSGMYEPTEGTVRYDGKERKEIPDVVFHGSLACVDQEVMLFEDTVSNNIRMWDDTISDFEMILAARDAQIYDRITREREGFDAAVQENGRNFSGGERQRLELSRALSLETSILLLDEFTSALDSLTEQKVFDAIRNKGVSCIIAAHRLSTVIQCDKIIVMDKGRIVEMGTHEELYRANGIYHKLIDTH